MNYHGEPVPSAYGKYLGTWCPHEDIEAFTRRAAITQGEFLSTAITADMHVFRDALRPGWPDLGDLPSVCQEVEWTSYQGHTSGIGLLDKSQYPRIIGEEMGYVVPRTVAVPRRAWRDIREIRAGIEALDPDSPRRFLKPLNGTVARGCFVAEDPDQALRYLRKLKEPYLIQQETASRGPEMRYALHRDSQAVEEGFHLPHRWRVAFAKERPSVVGDGRSTIDALFKALPDVPKRNRLKYRLLRPKDHGRVPLIGEYVELAVAGNTGGRLLTDAEVQVLDPFMVRLAGELEHHIGAPLATICFDIGQLTADALSGAYDHDRLKKELVLYEFQVPFSPREYLHNIPISPQATPKQGWIARREWSVLLTRSFYASGLAVRRRNEKAKA